MLSRSGGRVGVCYGGGWLYALAASQPWLVYAKEAKRSGGSGDTATCQVYSMDSVVGGCARKGHAACGGGNGGWRPRNCHWRRLLTQLMNIGETRGHALALPSVTQ